MTILPGSSRLHGFNQSFPVALALSLALALALALALSA